MCIYMYMNLYLYLYICDQARLHLLELPLSPVELRLEGKRGRYPL